MYLQYGLDTIGMGLNLDAHDTIGMGLNLDMIRLKRQQAQEEAARRKANFHGWKDGRNIIRILPPWKGAEDFSRIFGKHWGLGPDGKLSVYCPNICHGLKCPICEEISRLWKVAKPESEVKEYQEYLKRIGAAPRYYVNLLDMSDIDKGVQIGELPKTVLEEIWNLMVDEMTGLGDITNPDKGYDLIIDRTGSGMATRYRVTNRRESTRVDKKYLENLFDLDTLVKTESYESLRMVWEGKEPLALPAPAATIPSPIPVTRAAPPAPAMKHEDDVIDVPASAITPAVGDPALPPCFGSFNGDDARCLDCAEQDDCEIKVIEERKRAKGAKAAGAAMHAATPAAAASAPHPSAVGIPVTAPPPPSIEVDDLMAEMEKAISR